MSAQHIEVAIVGAGFAGLAAALELRSAGHDVALFERSGRVGGTWRDNVYPGVACDVPALLYQLERHPSAAWAGEFATGAEIQAYLERVTAAEGVEPRYGHALEGASWHPVERRWHLTLSGRAYSADVLVLACGRLTDPALPAVGGLDGFPGVAVHSSRWRPGLEDELAGVRVAVVGTGASAVQIAPALAARSEVTVFQRSAAWILPRGGRAYSDAERSRLDDRPDEIAAARAQQHAAGEARYASRSGDPSAAARAREQAEAHLAAQVSDTRLRHDLTPVDEFGCKRVLLSDEFYPALDSGRVRLEPSALQEVRGHDLVGASGRRHEAFDAIVLATGYRATRQPYAPLVRGDRGQTLAEHWSGGMTSFASTAVSGFPNMFVMNGPNAALGHSSSVLVLEQQARYIRRALAMRDERGGVVRVRAEAEAAYTRLIDERAAGTPWLSGCDNWYVDDRSGRLTLMWPGSATAFAEMIAACDGSEFAAEPELATEPAFDPESAVRAEAELRRA